MTIRSSTTRFRERTRLTGRSGPIARQGFRELFIDEVRAPEQADVGEQFSVTMTAQCDTPTGCNSERATISAGAEEFLNQFITIGDDSQRTVITSISFDEPGVHTIQFRLGGDAVFRDVQVGAPPSATPGSVEVTQVGVSPAVPTVGERATIVVTAQNPGEESAARSVDVTVDGTRVGSAGFSLQGGESDFDEVGWTPDVPGLTTIRAGGESVSVAVSEPAAPAVPGDINVTDVRVVPDDPVVNNPAEVVLDLENDGDLETTATVAVEIDGTEIGSAQVTLDGGETATRRIPWTPAVGGTVEVAAGTLTDLAFGGGTRTSVQTFFPGDINVTDLVVTPATPTVGEEATVDVTADNGGDLRQSASIAVEADGQPIGSVSFNLAGGAQGTERLTWTPATAGDVELAAGGTVVPVTVAGAPTPPPGEEPPPAPEIPTIPGLGQEATIAVGVGSLLLLVLLAR